MARDHRAPIRLASLFPRFCFPSSRKMDRVHSLRALQNTPCDASCSSHLIYVTRPRLFQYPGRWCPPSLWCPAVALVVQKLIRRNGPPSIALHFLVYLNCESIATWNV
ncbi:hypothetical protein BS47DRAFT_484831 [Hydnum rufescens UP504]|uniref:Uncharacterized protein n=1 Tax=Hydnum rufescens UP504 TaxID=1448309 RepID=A0A9P6AHK2_9AGAM|nr:hypothetical protein BS47DRAFT_484831 [Hydnum rufescens UP504]